MVDHIRGHLLALELGTPDPAGNASFYSDVFGTDAQKIGESYLCAGPSRNILLSPGTAKTLLSAAYALDDAAGFASLKARLGAHHVAFTDTTHPCCEAGAIAIFDPDGNRLVFGIAKAATQNFADAPHGRLQHCVVGSTNSARMVAFYRDILGFRESDRVLDGDALRTTFLRSDDEHHSFAVFQTSENRFDHHCYELPDWNGIRDWGDRLGARRIKVQWGPGRHGPGNNLFLFFHDPDGNWLEVSAEIEVVPSDRPVGVWPHEEYTLNSWGQAFLRS